jgi:hypothetical protein
MSLESFIEEKAAGLFGSVTTRNLLSLAAIVLLADSVLVLGFGANLLLVDVDWLKNQLSFGFVLGVLIGYAFIRAWILPWLRVFMGTPSLLFTVYISEKMKDRLGVRLGIRDDDLLAYALVRDNSVAYEEYKKWKELQRASLEDKELAILVLILGAVNFFASGVVPSLSQSFVSGVRSLPPSLSILIYVVTVLALLWMFLMIIVVTPYHARYVAISSERVHSDMAAFFEMKENAADDEG